MINRLCWLTSVLAAPGYDWQRPPGEPVIIDGGAEAVAMVRPAVQMSKFFRLPISVRANLAMQEPTLVAKIALDDEHAAEHNFALFSHRRRFGGTTHVRYDYSNFCEWLHEDRDQVLRIPLPNTNVPRKGSTEIRDIMLYLGYIGVTNERVADVKIAGRVVDAAVDERWRHPPYGAGCELFRYENTVPEFVRISHAKGYNTDVVMRGPVANSIALGSLDRDKFLTLTLDIPSYDLNAHRPLLKLTVTGVNNTRLDHSIDLHERIKVLAVPYTYDSIWEASHVRPIESFVSANSSVLNFDMTDVTEAIHRSKSFFSDRSVVVAIFVFDLIDSRPGGNPVLEVSADVLLEQETAGAAAVKPAPFVPPVAAAEREPSFFVDYLKSRDVVMEIFVVVFLLAIVHTLAQALISLTSKEAGYESIDARDVTEAVRV